MRSAALLLFASTAAAQKLLIAGDSWGNVVGGYLGEGAFGNKLKEHSCKHGLIENIAVPGTTASIWAGGTELAALKAAVGNGTDYIWLTLMGNDAQGYLPGCALKGTSAEECGDNLVARTTPMMEAILDAVEEVNPKTRVVGFGYDIMFSDTAACAQYPKLLFPQCFEAKNFPDNATKADHVTCFNTQFVRLQQTWEDLKAGTGSATKAHANLDVINVLGSCQVAGGDKDAAVGKPDMTHFNPPGYFTINMQCIHPSVSIPPKDTDGAMVIMESFYKQYWSDKLGC